MSDWKTGQIRRGEVLGAAIYAEFRVGLHNRETSWQIAITKVVRGDPTLVGATRLNFQETWPNELISRPWIPPIILYDDSEEFAWWHVFNPKFPDNSARILSRHCDDAIQEACESTGLYFTDARII